MNDNTIVIDAGNCTSTFSANHPPVAEVESGAIVTFETSGSCYEQLAVGNDHKIDHDYNLITGPVAIKGAKPGDTLRVDILNIEIYRAWTIRIPPLADDNSMFSLRIRELEIHGNKVGYGNALVEMDPMVGCIGVAPDKGYGSTIGPVGRWGGNMDLKELRKDASILLPVFHPGGLLSVGDLHAAMGQGEPLLAGIEASGIVTARISIIHGADFTGPRLLVPGATVCIGLGDRGRGDTLEQARHDAIKQGLQLLRKTSDIESWDSWIYASSLMDLSFGGPASSIVLCRVPDISIKEKEKHE